MAALPEFEGSFRLSCVCPPVLVGIRPVHDAVLAGLQAPDATTLARTVLDYSTSRNHGLDLLPVLESADAEWPERAVRSMW